jgi:inward rectifier potassium channel
VAGVTNGFRELFISINLLFAFAYLMEDGVRDTGTHCFADILLFSMQTMTTVGSSTVIPRSILANILVCLEAIIGVSCFAVIAGFAFARFSRPTARARFSRVAVVSNRYRIPSLMFRVAYERENQLLEAQIHVDLIRSEVTAEGERIRRFYNLKLMRYRNSFFALSWTVIHQITEQSPLFGLSIDLLASQQAVITVSLTALDETLLQTVPARHTYGPRDIVFGARFADILSPGDDSSWTIDAAHFDEIVTAPLTFCQTDDPASP